MDRPKNSAEAGEWVKRALAGNRGAQRSLAAFLSPVIRARIARRLRAAGRHDPVLVEDLSQELWSKLFDPARPILAKWELEGMSLENYVGQAAEWETNQRLRADRAAKRYVETEELSPELPAAIDIEATFAETQLAQHLFDRLHTELPPRGRLVLELLYRDQLSADQIAETLGVKRQVIYNWQHQIRSRAREILRSAGG
jgi:RNA polymerase sigma factor (sigma-70 family)